MTFNLLVVVLANWLLIIGIALAIRYSTGFTEAGVSGPSEGQIETCRQDCAFIGGETTDGRHCYRTISNTNLRLKHTCSEDGLSDGERI